MLCEPGEGSENVFGIRSLFRREGEVKDKEKKRK